MAGFKIEVPKYPKMSMGGIIDAYTKEQADELFQEKLTEKQLANISSVTDKADKLVEDIRYYYGTENIVPTDSSYFVYTDKGDGTCVISGVKENFSGTELIFPHEIDCLKVVELAPYTTSDNNSATTQITSIIMPDTVVKLSDNAFYYANLPNVTKIRLSNNLSTVGDMSLPSVQKLDELYVPDSLVNVGAMNHFTSMALRVSLPHHLFSHSEPGYTEDNAVITIRGGTETGAGAPCLGYGKNVTVVLPDTCIRIFPYLFWDMENPVLVIPSSVTEILQSDGGEGASIFGGCTNPTIICEQGSYADSFAQEYGINVKYNLVGNFYSREQADSKFQEKLSEKQLKNISAVEKKVDEEEGKGLSTNDYTTEEKQEVAKIVDKADVSYVRDNFANALKGTASGEAVAITDVSPVEHTMDVKVRSKNLLDAVNAPIYHTNAYSNPAYLWERIDTGVRMTALRDLTSSSYRIGYYIGTAEELKGKTITISGDRSGIGYSAFSIVCTNVEGSKANSDPINGTGSSAGRHDSSRTEDIKTTDYKQNLSTVTVTIPSTLKYSYIVVNFYGPLGVEVKTGDVVEWNNLQVEIGDTATPYTPFVPDVSVAKVNKYGANLLNYPTFSKATLTEDGIVSFQNAEGTAKVYAYTPFVTFPAGRYIASVDTISLNENGSYCIFVQLDDSNDFTRPLSKNQTSRAFTITKPTRIRLVGEIGVATDVQFKIQMNVGEVIQLFEPYKEPVTYTPNADGTVEGVTSLYPSTTLLTDTEGAVVTCEYNRDINKAFEELTNAIISLGGNV